MFPYRRQGGAKKRMKTGPIRGKARGGGNRPLPNSARELLPLFQPTTKALAQMLAGRSRASGQLNQARSLLVHVERLVSERAHNRLNPMEREEFFEQLARLKLTLADADAEAAAQEEKEREPERPAAPPIGRDRLREMALSLVTKGPDAERLGAPQAPLPPAPPPEPAPRPPARPAAAAPATADEGVPTTTADGAAARTTTAAGASGAHGSRAAGRSARLVLRTSRPVVEAAPAPCVEAPDPATTSDVAASTATGGSPERAPADEAVANGGAGHAAPGTDAPTSEVSDGSTDLAPVAVASADAGLTNGHDSGPADPALDAVDTTAATKRRGRKTRQGLPEGWVIDDEGFVVPGSS